jgi:hypothetical protein
VTNVDVWFFYHHMDLPSLGELGEEWDLRKTFGDYLGHFDFHGRRVFDVGTASGFLTFIARGRNPALSSHDRSPTSR